MQINEKRVIEILLALILVVVLIILTLLLTNPPQLTTKQTESQDSNPQIINSYNTYYTTPQYTQESSRPILVYDSSKDYYEDRYLSYQSTGERKIVQSIFGNSIEKYIVIVRNSNPAGGYYTVKFHFEDYYGKQQTKSVTQYLRAYEEKEFYYTDINFDRFKNYYWNYEVVSLTKIPQRNYITNQNSKYLTRDRNI